jgi:uncharacterized protein YjbI with pentapeptide repeats
MSELLLDERRPLHKAGRLDIVSKVARARTLTVLPRLDGGRKSSVLLFVYESDLVAHIPPGAGFNRLEHVFTLAHADLSGVHLRGANLAYINLSGANLREADMRGANLNGAHLLEANLFKADLRRAHLLRGVNLWNAILREADLRGAQLGSIAGENEGAKLNSADLTEAKLQGANLNSADLRWATLAGANLRGADMREADLRDTEGADMSGADMTNANLDGAFISGADLREVEGLSAEQIEQANGDSRTKLPVGISRPGQWDTLGLISSAKEVRVEEKGAAPPWEPLFRLVSALRNRLQA